MAQNMGLNKDQVGEEQPKEIQFKKKKKKLIWFIKMEIKKLKKKLI